MDRTSTTRQMLDAVSRSDRTECRNLPPEFLCGLRGALDAGLSCEQITALLVLFTGIYEAGEKLSGPELLERASLLACVMKGDIYYCQGRSQQARRNKEYQRALLKKRKRGFVG